MSRTTPKTLATRIAPNLESKKNAHGNWGIWDEGTLLVEASTSQTAWDQAYHLLAKDQFKVGDLLVMEGCAEAHSKAGKVWKCRYPSYLTSSGDYAVFLEGIAGYFCSEFLRKATTEEIEAYAESMQSEN